MAAQHPLPMYASRTSTAQTEVHRKIFLLGLAGAGKTSMLSIVSGKNCCNSSKVRAQMQRQSSLLGRHIHLWDLGGNDPVMTRNLLDEFVPLMDGEVVVLVFIVNSRVDEGWNSEIYRDVSERMRQHCKNAMLFGLVHKMDLDNQDERANAFQNMQGQIENVFEGHRIIFFPTSIWDETLYTAWSAIAQSLIPDLVQVQLHLDRLCQACAAKEIALYDRDSFMVLATTDMRVSSAVTQICLCVARRVGFIRHVLRLICQFAREEPEEDHRIEKISNIAKQFNFPHGRKPLSSITLKRAQFTFLIEDLTARTCIMVVTSRSVQVQAVRLNIAASRRIFERLIDATL